MILPYFPEKENGKNMKKLLNVPYNVLAPLKKRGTLWYDNRVMTAAAGFSLRKSEVLYETNI